MNKQEKKRGMERQKAKGCGTRIKETAENRIITNNAPSIVLYTPDDGNKGQAALTSPTAARMPPHFSCDQGFT